MKSIEVFADVCCPFTHVGLHRIIERLSQLAHASHPERPLLRVRAWPLELVNGEPMDADFIAEEIDALREQVAPDLFTGFDVASFPPTSLPALSLAADAYRISMKIGEAVSMALRDALFEKGLDIADPHVLAGIANAHGVAVSGDHAPVLADWHEGQARGVIGSPHFFIGGTGAFCPVLDIRRVDGHLRIRSDPTALDSFLAHLREG